MGIREGGYLRIYRPEAVEQLQGLIADDGIKRIFGGVVDIIKAYIDSLPDKASEIDVNSLMTRVVKYMGKPVHIVPVVKYRLEGSKGKGQRIKIDRKNHLIYLPPQRTTRLHEIRSIILWYKIVDGIRVYKNAEPVQLILE